MKCPYCGNEVSAVPPGNAGEGVYSVQCQQCGNWMPVNQSGFATPPAPAYSGPGPTQPGGPAPNPYNVQQELTTAEKLKKYFLHGLAFSILMLGVVIGWVFVLVFLFLIGSVIGLLIGIIILIYVMGWLNVNLTRYFWHISVDSGWKALLVHGFVLFIALLLVSIPQLIVSALIPSVITSIVVFLVYCFVDGFVAKNVAEKIF